ncbi:MAG: hypothetical protein QM784_19990 [Polyangiaceae bacterium]
MTNPLEDATKALREQYDGKPQGNEQFTRTRVMAELREQQRRARARSPFVIPIIALLLGSAAWAASSGRLVAVIERVTAAVSAASDGGDSERSRAKERNPVSRALDAASNTASVPSAPVAAASTPVTAFGTEPTKEIAKAVPSAPTTPSATASGGERGQLDRGRPLASAHPSAVSPTDDAATALELELYEAAHRAHFVEKDANAAFDAWTRYLDSNEVRQVPSRGEVQPRTLLAASRSHCGSACGASRIRERKIRYLSSGRGPSPHRRARRQRHRSGSGAVKGPRRSSSSNVALRH